MSGLNLHRSLTETPWTKSKEAPRLQSGQTHVWRINLEQGKDQEVHFLPSLSPDEVARSKRFYFDRDRIHYVLTRGTLRQLTGNYLGIEPTKIRFDYLSKGKPVLQNEGSLFFNVSHAGGHALLAFSRDRPIGVDLEIINRKIDIKTIASRFFSRLEIPVILGMPPHQQYEAFFLAWTRKEAIIKAHGDGLTLPLDQFGVSIRKTDEVVLKHLDWAPETVEQWRLTSFMVAEELPGALAMEGELGEVRFFYPDR